MPNTYWEYNIYPDLDDSLRYPNQEAALEAAREDFEFDIRESVELNEAPAGDTYSTDVRLSEYEYGMYDDVEITTLFETIEYNLEEQHD